MCDPSGTRNSVCEIIMKSPVYSLLCQRSEVSVSAIAWATAEGQRTVVRRPSSVCRPPSAFTLIELLVVIVVIAILMGITIPVSKYAIARAKAARQEVMLAKIRSALDDYRAAYGEYPITPDTNGVLTTRAETSKHYWDNVIPDINTFSNSFFTNVNLSTNTIEECVVAGSSRKVDYCLTFPLMLRQEREGKRSFIQFDKVSILYVVHKFVTAADEIRYEGKRKTKSGGMVDAVILYAKGRPVNRAQAIDPVSGRQWKYECYDGTSYTITTNVF